MNDDPGWMAKYWRHGVAALCAAGIILLQAGLWPSLDEIRAGGTAALALVAVVFAVWDKVETSKESQTLRTNINDISYSSKEIQEAVQGQIPGLQAQAKKWENVARVIHQFQHNGLISIDRLPTKDPGNVYMIHVFSNQPGYSSKTWHTRDYPDFLKSRLKAIRIPIFSPQSKESTAPTFFTADSLLPSRLRSAQNLHDYLSKALVPVLKEERENFLARVASGEADPGRNANIGAKDWREAMKALVWVQPLRLQDSRFVRINDPFEVPDIVRLFDEANDIIFTDEEQANIRDFVYGQDFSFVMEGEEARVIQAFNSRRKQWDKEFQCKTILGYRRVPTADLVEQLAADLGEEEARGAVERLKDNLTAYRDALQEINVSGLELPGEPLPDAAR